jgi:hypothetical protein
MYWFASWALDFVPIFGLVRLLRNRALARHAGDAHQPLTDRALWLALILVLASTANDLYRQTQ